MNLLRASAKAANRRHREGKDGATGLRRVGGDNSAEIEEHRPAPPLAKPLRLVGYICQRTEGPGGEMGADDSPGQPSKPRPSPRAPPIAGRFMNDEAGALQMLDQALRHDRSHDGAEGPSV